MKTGWWSLLLVCGNIFTALGQQNEITHTPFNSSKENLGPAINSQYAETKPVISAEGEVLYFCRQNHPDNTGGAEDHQDIYYSKLKNGKWSPAVNMGKPLNDQHPNGICSVAPDGNSALLINEYIDGGSMKPGASLSQKTGNGWSFPEQLEIEDFYNFSAYVDYFLSSDNKALLLSVQRRHGFGDQDLYVSFFEKGKWTSPVNLGPTINTPGADFAPFLAADGKTLYFASEGHRGFGGSDIYLSKRLDNTWSNWTRPLNLGPAVNSKGHDAYYSISSRGDYAFFVSNSEQNNSKDIYRIKLPDQLGTDPVVLLKGKVLNVNTNEPVSASISFKPYGVTRSDPENGTYKIVLPKGSTHYFQAEVEGYLTMIKSRNLNEASEYTELEQDLYLVPLVRGQKIPLNNIFFVRSQPELLPQSYRELDQLVAILKQHSTLEIELGGHTDNLGQASLNFDLSLKRVDAVKEYLISRGIGSGRLHTKGYGDTQPIARNDHEFNRRQNRRVEFTILSL